MDGDSSSIDSNCLSNMVLRKVVRSLTVMEKKSSVGTCENWDVSKVGEGVCAEGDEVMSKEMAIQWYGPASRRD